MQSRVLSASSYGGGQEYLWRLYENIPVAIVRSSLQHMVKTVYEAPSTLPTLERPYLAMLYLSNRDVGEKSPEIGP